MFVIHEENVPLLNQTHILNTQQSRKDQQFNGKKKNAQGKPLVFT